jgi:hypothetical protein
MTSIDIPHRVLMYDTKQSNKAFEWAKLNLELEEWESEVFDNSDCFYFTNELTCSIFVLVNGGKYIAPPRGTL